MTERDTAEKGLLRSWWVTMRRGSRFTRAGRALRASLRDDLSQYVEVERPGCAGADFSRVAAHLEQGLREHADRDGLSPVCSCACHQPTAGESPGISSTPVSPSSPAVLDLTPGSPAWSRLITASKVAAILGVNPWQSPYALWREMRGDVQRPEAKAHQRRGHYLEPAILAWFWDRHPTEFDDSAEQVTYRLGDWAAATPDAVAWLDCEHDNRDDCGSSCFVLVEAKSAARMDEWGEPGTDQIPSYYLTQVHWQLHVSRAARCYVPVIGPFLEFSEYVVERDDEVGALLEAKCRAFYDSLAGDVPPDLDGSYSTFEVLKRLHPEIEPKAVAYLDDDQAAEFVDACNAKEAAEARERLARSRVLEAMGNANYADAMNGTRIARRQANKSGISLVRVAKTTDGLTTTEGDAA